MLKHAYLIMAHNEWDLLRTLVSCLDDVRNDIFVHIDAKVRELPEVSSLRAGLFFVEDRVDVRWGDISVVSAEYVLFSAAVQNGPYAYYHLLSGVDLPLKTQDYIHNFCAEHQGKEFIGYTVTELTTEITRKVQRWHLFPRSFRDTDILKRASRSMFLRMQDLFGMKRNSDIEFKKGSQWVSVTDGMARYFLDYRDWAMRVFQHTFCADEIVMQTLCWQSPYRNNIYDIQDDGRGCMRKIGWRCGCLVDWNACDFEDLAGCDALFARKFNSNDWKFIQRIVALSR